MAQEIMVAGAIYEDVPSVRLPDSDGVFHPFTDTSDTTAVAADVADGKLFHLADGALATGTASGGGGGGESVNPKDVNFIDYDGTIVHSYTAAEFLALTAMPENPTHEGLVSQGWNWTLADAQEYVGRYGIQTIGQMYATESGNTEIDIVLHEGRLSPWLSLAPNGTVTIDWGDGSTDTVTGTSTTTPINTRHDYAAAGAYTIKVSVESGELGLGQDSVKPVLNKNSATINENRVYSCSIVAARIGSNVSSMASAFRTCVELKTVTLPNDIASIGEYAIFLCPKIASCTIPSGINSIDLNMASNNPSLSSIAIPKSVVSSEASGLFTTGLVSIALPPDMASIAANFVASNNSLTFLAIPEGVTEIGTTASQSNSALISLTIPDSVTSISTSAFNSAYGLASIHFKRTTPPSLGRNAFANLPTDCIIYVPQGSLSAYTSAANYPSASTYTYVEE